MQDPRAMANSANLRSYRAWQKEGYRRSGFYLALVLGPALTPIVTCTAIFFRPVVAGRWERAALLGAAFAVYVTLCLGLMLMAALRLRAFRRDNPWTPPTSAGAARTGQVSARRAGGSQLRG